MVLASLKKSVFPFLAILVGLFSWRSLDSSDWAAARAISSEKTKIKALIFINTHEPSFFQGLDPYTIALQAFEKLSVQYPGDRQFYIEGTSNEQVATALNKIFGNNDVEVDALEIESHGESGIAGLTLLGGTFEEGQPYAILSNESNHYVLNLFSKELDQSLAPLKGRFSRGARIIFYGCNLLDFGGMQLKTEAVSKFAEKIGLERGLIYMNEGSGLLPSRDFAAEQVSSNPLTWINHSLADRALNYLMENHSNNNQGFSLIVYPRGGNQRTVLKRDGFLNAEIRSLEE